MQQTTGNIADGERGAPHDPGAEPLARGHARVRRLACAAVVALAALVAYGPALRGDFVWDDDFYVYENPLLWQPDGLWRMWFTSDFESQYFPLTITALRLQYGLWGLETLGYHLVNVGIHLLNGALLWMLLGHLRVTGAGLIAAIFVLHPVQVESVAWITELKNVLSTTFYILAAAAYLRFEGSARARWYLVAFVLFVLGMLSKTVVCTLPGVLLVLRWWRGRPIGVGTLALLLPFVIVGIGMGLFAAWYEVAHIGTAGAEFGFSIGERLLIAGRAPWFYLGKLLVPAGLAFSYPRWVLDTSDPGQWAWLVCSVGTAAVLWVGRHRAGRGPAAGLACFVVMLSPMLGFVNYYTMRYSFVADHYQYLACVGAIAVAVGGVSTLIRAREPRGGPGTPVLASIGALAVLGALGVLTWRQAHAYRDPGALWQDTIAKNPGSWMAHNNLGNWLVDRGAVEEALEHYEIARRLNPEYADPYSNIASVLVDRGEIAAAIPLFEHAIALEPGTGDFQYNLGVALARAGREEEALAALLEAVDVMPTHHAAHNNLGILLARRGRLEEALGHYGAALREAPEVAEIRENLADALVATGDLDGAEAAYREAARLAPTHAGPHLGLGHVAAERGEHGAAIAHYERAVALAPGDADARYNLATQLAAVGRQEEAAARYREVLESTPDDVAAANNLAVTLRALGRTDEAIETFEAVLARDPGDREVRYNLAIALLDAGRGGKAIDVARRGLARMPEDAALANFLAWLHATSPVDRWRDAAAAVRLAEQATALTDHADPNYLDTLAAAYAEAGRFDDAVRVAEQTIALLADDEAAERQAEMRERLALYRAGRPYRERR
jgi:tetratricopeptide (TPR) repeat protein